MKNLLFQKSNQIVFVFGFLMILISSVPTFATTTISRKMVLYKGEWITRVDMPEVSIKADRIKNKKIIFKNVETVYYRGIKTLHITLEDIVIPASGNTDVSSKLIENPEYKTEMNYASLNPKLASNSSNTETIYSEGTYYASAKENVENSGVNTKSDPEITKAKKPLFNRIVNSIIDAGFNFLKKVNDGLFFKS